MESHFILMALVFVFVLVSDVCSQVRKTCDAQKCDCCSCIKTIPTQFDCSNREEVILMVNNGTIQFKPFEQKVNILNLSRNSIESLNPILLNIMVPKIVDLSENKIKVLENDTFTKTKGYIQVVYLNNNKIETIESDAFEPIQESLEELYLNGNRLRVIFSFEKMVNLRVLNLNGNLITNLIGSKKDRIVFPDSIQYLYLSYNRNLQDLQGLPFSRLTKLKYLELSNNRIFYLKPRIFKTLLSINTIDLSNQILANDVLTVQDYAFEIDSIDNVNVSFNLAGNKIMFFSGDNVFSGIGNRTFGNTKLKFDDVAFLNINPCAFSKIIDKIEISRGSRVSFLSTKQGYCNCSVINYLYNLNPNVSIECKNEMLNKSECEDNLSLDVCQGFILTTTSTTPSTNTSTTLISLKKRNFQQIIIIVASVISLIVIVSILGFLMYIYRHRKLCFNKSEPTQVIGYSTENNNDSQENDNNEHLYGDIDNNNINDNKTSEFGPLTKEEIEELYSNSKVIEKQLLKEKENENLLNNDSIIETE